jgi:hypothetical protein
MTQENKRAVQDVNPRAGEQVQEAIIGSGSGDVGKRADVMFVTPPGPVQGEIPMPVNMAPQAPAPAPAAPGVAQQAPAAAGDSAPSGN